MHDVKYFEENVVAVVRLDTAEEVERRAMTETERQRELDLKEKEEAGEETPEDEKTEGGEEATAESTELQDV